VDGVDRAPLDRVRRALHAIEAVTTVPDILEALVGQLAHEFARVALFMVRHNRLEGWCGRGFNPTIDIENIVMPLTIASPLTRALTDRTPATLAASADGITVGLFGGPVAWAMALPVLAQGRVIAVAYAEHPEELPADTAAAGQQIAEMLTDHVSWRISARQSAEAAPPADAGQEELGQTGAAPAAEASPAYPGPARQAHRVKVGEGIDVEVLVDGIAGLLIDLSTLGAQVLSSSVMRPRQRVRMLLPRKEGAFLCKGRIVWAAFELSSAHGTPRYRAGVKFTEVDASVVEAFLVQHGLLEDHLHEQHPHAGTRP
jgi:hypothetical protein